MDHTDHDEQGVQSPSARSAKIKTHFTWDTNDRPNRLSRFFMRKTNILDQVPDKKPFNFVLLGFLIPFLGLCLTYLCLGIFMELCPSAHPGFSQVFSMLKSDAYHQYFPFFVDFREKLRNGENLLYAWDIGMGIDYLGLYAYYLGSPLNLISVIFPEAWLLDYFTLLTPIRLGLAGMFFALFLKKTFDRNDLSIALFGSFYATCAWAFGYMWNTMWLDTFALLPLVVLGTLSLLKERKFLLYTVSLFLSVAINYYIGFFTCIFTLLVFICYEICRWKGIRRFLADLALMGVFTLLAIGTTAIITLPAYSSLLSTSAGDKVVLSAEPGLKDKVFKLNMTDRETSAGFGSMINWIALVEGMIRVATNTFSFRVPNSVASEGNPNVYCGVFALIFGFLFITCKQVKWRDRICGILMLLFLNLSFVIDKLNYIWHGFHDANMIPYRFSFLYSFTLLYLAYRAWLLRRRFRPWQLITASSLSIIFLFLSPGFRDFLSIFEGGLSLGALISIKTLFPFANLFFIAGYMAALFCSAIRKSLPSDADSRQIRTWYRKLHFRRSLSTFLLVLFICAELFFNYLFMGITTDLVVDAANFPKGTTDTAAVVDYMQNQDTELFYRAEVTHKQSFNDGALIGYNGVTTFTSSANAAVTNFMECLGFDGRSNYNRYAYTDSSPIADMFLNLKYKIERDTVLDNPYVTDIYSSGNVHLLRNDYALPLGFMADPQLAKVSFTAQERFGFQNSLLSAALGQQVTAWKHLPPDSLQISASDSVTVLDTAKATKSSCNFTTSGQSGYVQFQYTIEEAGYFCAYFSFYNPTIRVTPDIRIYIDHGEDLSTEPVVQDPYSLPFSLTPGQVEPGDRVRIVIECDPNLESTSYKVWAALLDETVMKSAHSQLSRSTLTLTKFDSTLVEGTIDCEKAGLLYTSIPQTGKNWHAFVDGQEAEIVLIGNAMIGLMLEEGTHTITFRYENKAYEIGLIVSLSCIMVFIGICIILWIAARPKPKAVTESGKTEEIADPSGESTSE